MRIHQNRHLGLPQHVNKSRGDHHAVRVDGLLGWRRGEFTDRGDAPIANAYVSRVPRGTRAIDDVAVGDQDIKGSRLSSCDGAKQKCSYCEVTDMGKCGIEHGFGALMYLRV